MICIYLRAREQKWSVWMEMSTLTETVRGERNNSVNRNETCVNSFVFVVLLSQWSSVYVLFSLEMKYSKIYRIKSIINIDLSYINVLYSVCVCVCVKMMLNKTSTDLVKSNSLLWYRIIKKKGNLF